MPPRTYEEAIRNDSELMRLSEEIMNLDGCAGSNPSKAALQRIARAQQRLEDRHEAIRREIEEEVRSAEAKAEAEYWKAHFDASPGAIEFAAYVESLGKSASVVSMLKALFVNPYTLAIQPRDIKKKMRWHLDEFVQGLTEEKTRKYLAAIDKLVEATGDVDPNKFDPNPAAREFTAFLQSIEVDDGTVYFFGDLFVDCQGLAGQPEDIKNEMRAALDAFIQELTEEQIERYSIAIDEVREAARIGTHNVDVGKK